MRKIAKATVLAALIAGAPALALAADNTTRGAGAGNTETNPPTQPSGSFNQGVGGVGNQGQVGGNPRGGAASTQTRDRQTMQQQCGGMTGTARDNCMRDYRAGAANRGDRGTAGDPQSRDFNKGSGGTGGTPPQ
jgi:hypothetical protein